MVVSKKKRPREEIEAELNQEKAVVQSWEPSEKKTKMESLLKKKNHQVVFTKENNFKAPKYKLE